MNTLESSFQALVGSLSRLDCVCAIGKTGGAALPTDGFSDIDLFVFCERLPTRAEREALYHESSIGCSVEEYGTAEHPHWGLVDSLLLGEQEVYPMFFSKEPFVESIKSILRGERTQRELNYFYPTGRCASILGIYPCYDTDALLSELKQLCGSYPDSLRNALMNAHLPKLDDEEDFQRAIRRGDVLFFHSTLDLALDSFLQALFALNRVYFPSRKRSLEQIALFQIKPRECEERLLRVVEQSVRPDTLSASHKTWQHLCAELIELVEENRG
jgi:hypothetical protein